MNLSDLKARYGDTPALPLTPEQEARQAGAIPGISVADRVAALEKRVKELEANDPVAIWRERYGGPPSV